MSDEPIDLIAIRNERLASEKHDGRLWSPLECLKALVRDLEDGTMKPVDMVYVAMRRQHPDGTSDYPYYNAGGAGVEVKGLLAQHLFDICK